jgi:hypothetical protein
MWRNDVHMHALPEGGFVFTAWEPARVPDVGSATHPVIQYRGGVPWGQVVGDAAYQRIYEAFPVARAGLETDGVVLLTLDA